MKGRAGAAHFAAFPRPPNYRNPNPNERTNIKEKKLKRILASVFLVLAVVAAVGIFGVQTSNQAEATVTVGGPLNSGAGVDDLSVVNGTSLVVDLSKYVVVSGSETTTYHLVAAEDNSNQRILDTSATAVYDAPNERRWNNTRINVSLSGSMLTITGVGVGETLVQWVADNTPANNDLTDASTYDTYAATGNNAARTDTFSVSVRAALTSSEGRPIAPAQDAETGSPARPVWSGNAKSDSDSATEAGPIETVDLTSLPAHGNYQLAVEFDDDIVDVEIGGGHGDVTRTVTIYPRAIGTTDLDFTITHAHGHALVGDIWTFSRTFTVNPAVDAPDVDIYLDIGAEGKDDDDPRGGADDPINFTIASDAAGKFAELKTDSGDDETYQNRLLRWALAPGNGADITANFQVTPGVLIDAVGRGGGSSAQTSTTELRVAPNANLVANRTYVMTVVAQDHVQPDAGPPEVEGGKIDSVTVTIRVIQANRAPTLTTPATLTIPENTAVDAMLIDLDDYAVDLDRQVLTFGLVDKSGQTPAENLVSGGKVEIDDDTNELRLAEEVDYEDVDDDGETTDEDTAAEQPDGYDRDAVRWRGTITVTDGVVTVEKKIGIAVSDDDETVTGPTTPGLEFSIDENNEADAVVGTVGIPSAPGSTTILDSGYDLNPNADGGGIFDISDAGVLTVIDAGALNYEEQSQYLLVATSGTQLRPVTVNVNDVNEAPVFNRGDSPTPTPPAATATPTPLDDEITTDVYRARVSESADVGDAVSYGWSDPDDDPIDDDTTFTRGAIDPDVGDVLTYSLVAANSAGTALSSPEVAFSGPFAINASTGAITVSGRLDAEAAGGDEYVLYVKVSDDDATDDLSDEVKLTITVIGENEPPYFVTGRGSTTRLDDVAAIALDENTPDGTVVARYYAVDPDGDDVTFLLRGTGDLDFAIDAETGVLTVDVPANRELDYETKASYELEVEVVDNQAGQGQILQTINLNNLNDNAPVWQTGFSPATLSVNENVLRDTPIVGGVYRATDADGDTVTYTLSGPNGSQYQIGSADGVLKTLASLDHETNTTDSITVTASDGLASNNITQDTRISIGDVNDRIGSITVRMANPVLGTNGDPNSALADRKTTESLSVPEAPTDLPATSGRAVVNFVETSAASWGSVLRIEVLAQSADSACGNGNQCVVVELEGDDSDDILKVMAYRNSLKDNLFVTAVMPVANASMATAGTAAVYKHTDNGVPRIQVDEEDTLRIKFGNLRDSVTIDNEAPEFANFLPEHEASTDDDEVDYTFTVTDAISGIPEPEDLPDADGDDAYMAVAALVNTRQCHNVAAGVAAPSGMTMVPNTNLHEGAQIYCPTGTSPEVRVIVDDKDLDSVDGGYDVDTKVVLTENRISFVTFIACDAAGNCIAFDPDENDAKEALAEITVDTDAPDLSEARTGVMWDAADNAYDDSRTFIQAIFNDLSKLNPDTIEADDFVVDGYTIKRVYWYDDPDAGDQNWGTRYDSGSRASTYQAISKTVFIELEEELLPDSTPDVSVVPNGLEDEAGNEQDDDEVEADDWIAPKFTVTDISSPRTTARDNVLVGEDEKVTITVTSDERINTTKPLVDVNAVNAPDGCVDRGGIILRAGRDTDGDGRVEPIEARNDCPISARGTPINSVISKDGTNEWTITVDKPTQTGYYNVYIYADDRSSQNNRGSEGVAPDKIVTDFFEKDGDVNSDDAVFFEGDVQLPKPQVVVSGEQAGDTEPTVEFKRPLFVEVDFTEPFSADCTASDKLSNKIECISEDTEYSEDGFDAVTVTRFELDGVDMTDDVKTTDDKTFLVALDDVSIGDHEIKIQAMDLAGNELNDVLEIEFEVEERDPFTRRLNPGWNLVSLPGSPEDSAIASVFGSDIEVRTVYTYNPVTPGGWQVAVRETLDDAWQGDLTDITAKSGYWVLSDAIQDLEVSIPRLAGGAVGASTPVQPPVIPMYAGWNLIPVVDVTGDALDADKAINATTYLNSLDDGLDLARVLGFNTITNEWFTVIDPSDTSVVDDLQIGSAYWVFVRESASLVPGGIPR